MSANSPNPLVPQGSLQQQTGKAKANVRLAVFSIIAVHAVLIVGVLMQGGCKKDEPKVAENETGQPAVPPDPFYSNPADLTASTTPASPLAGAPTVGTTDPAAGTPMPVTDPFAAPTTPAAPPVVMTPSPEFGAPGGVPALTDPAPAVQQYSIAKGDNFYLIAKKLNTTTKKIIEANPNVDPTRLQIGQKINVPVSATTAPTGASAYASAAPVAAGGTTIITHDVKPGDTLYGIATKYGSSVKAIQSANAMKTTRINVGQKLKVPAKASAAAPAPEPVITAPASVAPVIPVIPGPNNP